RSDSAVSSACRLAPSASAVRTRSRSCSALSVSCSFSRCLSAAARRSAAWSRRVARRAAPAASETYSRSRSGSAISTWLTSPWPMIARPERPRPEPASASSTSRKRALRPFSLRRVVPSRSRLRQILTLPCGATSSTSTSARPIERLPLAPWKIRSVLSSALNAEARPPPVVQRRASMTFDLPEPLGPTIAVTPGANSIVVRSPKLLKPCSVSEAIRTPQDNPRRPRPPAPSPCPSAAGRRTSGRGATAPQRRSAGLLAPVTLVGGRQAPARRRADLAAELGLEAGDAVLHAALELVEALPEADDLLDPGEVHAQLLREAPDLAELLDVALRVEARLARAAAGLDEALALVEPECLGVHVDELGRDADHVERLVLVDALAAVTLVNAFLSVVATLVQGFPPEASLRNHPRAARSAPPTRSTSTVRRRSPPPSPAPLTTRVLPSAVPGGTST